MASYEGSDITFGTIPEEDYQAIHAEEDRQKQRGRSKVGSAVCTRCVTESAVICLLYERGQHSWARSILVHDMGMLMDVCTVQAGKPRKKKQNKLMATLSDIFSTADIDDSTSVRSRANSKRWKNHKRDSRKRDMDDTAVQSTHL